MLAVFLLPAPCGLAQGVAAGQGEMAQLRRLVLPNAPDAAGLLQSAANGQAAASAVSGTASDVNGGVVPAATVTLTDTANGEKRTAAADSNGFFRFDAVSPGSYSVTISAPGFESRVQTDIAVQAGHDIDLPRMPLPVASTGTDIRVVYSQRQIAEEQLKNEEQQRLFGIVPNFYTSYVWDAEPLSTGEKFRLSLRALVDPFSFVGTGLAAGGEQWQNVHPAFEQGAQGYALRYGSIYGTNVTGVLLGRAILPVLFHQDPRYFYKGTGTTKERARYAITRAFITRGDDGRWQPAYAGLIGNFGAGALSNFYLDPKDRNFGSVTIGNGFLGLAFDAADGLLREFVWKSVTTGAAAKARQ